jgi:hypothetical protein
MPGARQCRSLLRRCGARHRHGRKCGQRQRGAAFARAQGLKIEGPVALATLRFPPWETRAKDMNMLGPLGRKNWFETSVAKGPRLYGDLVHGSSCRGASLQHCAARAGVDRLDHLRPAHPPAARRRRRWLVRLRCPLFAQFYPTDPQAALIAIGADITMTKPARFVAREATHAGQPAWLCRPRPVGNSAACQPKIRLVVSCALQFRVASRITATPSSTSRSAVANASISMPMRRAMEGSACPAQESHP